MGVFLHVQREANCILNGLWVPIRRIVNVLGFISFLHIQAARVLSRKFVETSSLALLHFVQLLIWHLQISGSYHENLTLCVCSCSILVSKQLHRSHEQL